MAKTWKVDRLLKDPRHGQRWARHWMDIWRYSEWWGLGQQLRNSQHHMWHFRDWIVESLNADLGYDEMVQLMLAAASRLVSPFPELSVTFSSRTGALATVAETIST